MIAVEKLPFENETRFSQPFGTQKPSQSSTPQDFIMESSSKVAHPTTSRSAISGLSEILNWSRQPRVDSHLANSAFPHFVARDFASWSSSSSTLVTPQSSLISEDAKEASPAFEAEDAESTHSPSSNCDAFGRYDSDNERPGSDQDSESEVEESVLSEEKMIDLKAEEGAQETAHPNRISSVPSLDAPFQLSMPFLAASVSLPVLPRPSSPASISTAPTRLASGPAFSVAAVSPIHSAVSAVSRSLSVPHFGLLSERTSSSAAYSSTFHPESRVMTSISRSSQATTNHPYPTKPYMSTTYAATVTSGPCASSSVTSSSACSVQPACSSVDSSFTTTTRLVPIKSYRASSPSLHLLLPCDASSTSSCAPILPSDSATATSTNSSRLGPLSLTPAARADGVHVCPQCHSLCQQCVTQRTVPATRRRWRRILYEKQDYEDNYVDESFLSSLVTNAHVHPREFWPLVQDTLVITQQVSMVTLFHLIFGVTYNNDLSSTLLIAVDIVAFLMALCILLGLNREPSWNSVLLKVQSDGLFLLKRGILFIGALLGLSPVLKTLTLSYSSDTIWALTIVLSVVHLTLYDYGYINNALPSPESSDSLPVSVSTSPVFSRQRQRVPFEAKTISQIPLSPSSSLRGTISLNAAIFAAVLLASRLNEHLLNQGPATSSPMPPSRIANTPASTSLRLSGWLLDAVERLHPGFSKSGNVVAFGDPLVAAVASGEVAGDQGAGGSLAVFALIFFAFEIFAGFPIVARHIKTYSLRCHHAATLFLFTATFLSLLIVFPLLAFVYFMGIILITFVCPFWLKWIQRYKNEIQGPWDYNDDEEGLG